MWLTTAKLLPQDLFLCLRSCDTGTWCITNWIIIMATLWNRAGHYIFALWFLLLSSLFFFRLISAVAEWMSTILLHMVCP